MKNNLSTEKNCYGIKTRLILVITKKKEFLTGMYFDDLRRIIYIKKTQNFVYIPLLTSTIFFSGIKVIFRVALVLFKIVFGDAGNFKDCPTLYETLEKLRHIPIQHLDEELVVQDVSALYVSRFLGTDSMI